jgi:nitric oxide reductase NorD protein
MEWSTLFEPEEAVGHWWDAAFKAEASYPVFEDAAVDLEDVRNSLGVFFRGLGGSGAKQIVPVGDVGSDHKLSLRQRLGMDRESMALAACDPENLRLPSTLAYFSTQDLNRDHYFWLAAFFTTAEQLHIPTGANGLAADLVFLRQCFQTSQLVQAQYPGLALSYDRLCEHVLQARPKRRLTGAMADMEQVVVALLCDEVPPRPRAQDWLAFVQGGDAATLPAEALVHNARSYRPFLPVPLWGQVEASDILAGAAANDQTMDVGSGEEEEQEERHYKGKRQKYDQTERNDPLILNRFEKILSWAEMLNLNRAADDDEEENARKAANDLDEINLASHQHKTSTNLKLEVDVAGAAVDTTALNAPLMYPEWDYRSGHYHQDHCAVFASTAETEGESWAPDEDAKRRIRQVRRQFEALRPKRQTIWRQLDGDELDIDAVVQSRSDLAAGHSGSDAIWGRTQDHERDMAVALLVDVSLSTDSYIDNYRVLDVEKEALTVLAHGLEDCGDDLAIYSFTSRKRQQVLVETVKEFSEPVQGVVSERISAMKPGYYTRIGAAIRHVTAELMERPNKHKLLLVLSDGKPNDLDHYEGQYGIEDTRIAVQEARRKGMAVFGITVDKQARDYVPRLFGQGGFAIIGQINHLSTALPKIYRTLID